MNNLSPEIAVGGSRHGLQQAYYNQQSPEERFAKADARHYVLEYFKNNYDTSRPANLFTLPGGSFEFEHAWLTTYRGPGAVVGFERFGDVLNLALRRMSHRPRREIWTYDAQPFETYHAAYPADMAVSMILMPFERFLTLDVPKEYQLPVARRRWTDTYRSANLIWLDLMTTISGPSLQPSLENIGRILDSTVRSIPFALTFATQRAKNRKQRGVVMTPDDPVDGYRKAVKEWLEDRTRRRYAAAGVYCYRGKGHAHMCLMWGLLHSRR